MPHAARCNTSCHGIEELLSTPPPYLFQEGTVSYTVTDADGKTETVTHKRHGFAKHGQVRAHPKRPRADLRNGYVTATQRLRGPRSGTSACST